MFNNPYLSNFNQQQNVDRINEQIRQLENIKTQMQQPTQQPTPINLTQNFQPIESNKDVIRYAASMEEVGRNMVIGDTPYFSKDMSVVWIKNTKGEIKTYELNEIIPRDEKDIKIEFLMAQIEELKKGMKQNDEPLTNVSKPDTTTSEDEEPTDIPTTTKSNKKSK